VAVKVRAASARVFVEWPNSNTIPQQLAVGCGTLISSRFVITASHILPETGDAKVWVLLGQQTRLRAATVYKRMCAQMEDVTLLQLERPVTDVEPLGLSLTPPRQLQSMAMVGFHPPLEKAPNNIVSVVHEGTGGDLQLESNQPLRQAQIEAFAHSSFDPTDGVAIGWSDLRCHATPLSPAVCRPLFDSLLLCAAVYMLRYPCFGGTSGSAVVDARNGRVVGVHTQRLWLNEHDSAPQLVHKDSEAAAMVNEAEAATEAAREKARAVDDIDQAERGAHAAAAAAPASAAASSSLSKQAAAGPDSRTRSSSVSLIMADIGRKGLIGQFQTLAHKTVLQVLRGANIVEAAQSSELAMPQLDFSMTNYNTKLASSRWLCHCIASRDRARHVEYLQFTPITSYIETLIVNLHQRSTATVEGEQLARDIQVQ